MGSFAKIWNGVGTSDFKAVDDNEKECAYYRTFVRIAYKLGYRYDYKAAASATRGGLLGNGKFVQVRLDCQLPD
jgi:hypothetical protein